MDLTKCISEGGNFLSSKWFVQHYGTIPSVLTLTFKEEEKYLDVNQINETMINAIVPGIIFYRQCISKYTKGDVKTQKYSEAEMDLVPYDTGSLFQFATQTAFYHLDYNSITVKYVNGVMSEWEEYLIEIYDSLPKRKPQDKEAIIGLVGYKDGDYFIIDSAINNVAIDLEENYNDDFLPVFKDTIDFLNTRESGLVLYYGSCGTGKTSFIRYLVTNYPNDYILIPSSMVTRLSDPDFISFLLDNTSSIFILEDCEQVLMDRSVNMFNGAISNILNMSDGLLSDIMNLKFICTFNADIEAIDPALLRKGRCYAKYEFKELCADKVAHLNEKYNLGITNIKPMTLADIYNLKQSNYEEKKSNKIGF